MFGGAPRHARICTVDTDATTTRVGTHELEAVAAGNVTTSGNTTSVVWNIGVDAAGSTVSGVQVYMRDGTIQTAFPVAAP